jgi:hypothetical protein
MIDNTALIALDSFIAYHTKVIRNERIITDRDLAGLFMIDINQLRKKVKANLKRFPCDFMLILSKDESNRYDRAKYAFTEAGLFMLSGLIKTERAAKISISMVELFTERLPGKVFELLRFIR